MTSISTCRKEVGLTQCEVAQKLGITEGTYRSKENGHSSFKDYEIVKLYELFEEQGLEISFADIFLMLNRRKKDVIEREVN